jgi:hypothetical protein
VKSRPWTVAQFQQSEFLTYLQSFLVQILSLFVLLTPLARDSSLRTHLWEWTWLFGAASIVSAVLSPALYRIKGPAWSSLLSFLASISQAFIVLQLIKGIQRLDLARQKMK